MRETTGEKIFRTIVLIGLTLFVALPLYVMITTSMKPLGDVQAGFSWLPSTITFQPFIEMWSTVPLARYFMNSLIVTLAATLLSVTVATLAAYAVSRWRFHGRGPFMTTVLSTQMFPGVLFLLPLYLIFVNIDTMFGVPLVGTRIGLTITYLTFSLPFAIWMLVGYFDGIPRELDQAGKVDGAGNLTILLRIILPAARPGIVAVAIYAFMTAWGEVLFASVLTTEDTRTLAVGLQQYSTQTNVYWNQVLAASLAVSIPVVAGFLMMQKNFVAGLTAGAVK
ncbi:carbohydrate ABC transporter permease [Brachybacterium fresconis]|uniref:Multiple sugar transport system permease protein n=1 Tax=Brachybacterium fresconis TaxID=173363 RepID=A0ABS4YMX7_9MICO|nr:carbohydrate ABC transporter permease [Brachybacterium fresconis]MBP2410108.1 multiple sugar transport system permease protein [Brachybacterium fresconis]